VKESPEDLAALAELAIGYYQTQAWAKAEETYKKMISLKDSAELHNNLANVYRDWQKIDQAVAEYRKAIELDPASALSYGNLAALYMMNGDIEKAREVAEEGIEKSTGAGKEQLQRLRESFE
jgi:Flp pilus assembly protein TadD